MSKTLFCDVLIAGGGPAGLSVASVLSKDIKSIVIHKDSEIGKPVRTSGGSWLFDAQELNLPSYLYQIIENLDFYSDSEHVSFKIRKNKPIVFDVTGLYRYLKSLSDNLSRDLFLSTKFVQTRKNADGLYESVVHSKESGTYSIVSKYLVDATGVQCSVLKNLSLIHKPERIGVGIEYEYDLKGNPPDRAILIVGSSVLSGYGWIFPTPDSKIRVGVGIIRPDSMESLKFIQKNFIKSSSLHRFGVSLSKNYTINSGYLPSISYREKLVFGNVISIGDNANFATPTVGEGIRFAIKYGRILGEALNQAIKNKNMNYLNKYEKDAKKEFKKNYKLGLIINSKMSSYSPEDWDKLVRKLRYFDEEGIISLLRSEFSIKAGIKLIIKHISSKALNVFKGKNL